MKTNFTEVERKILKIILYNPSEMLPLLKSSFKEVSRVYSFIKKMIPTMTGIEIETGQTIISEKSHELFKLTQSEIKPDLYGGGEVRIRIDHWKNLIDLKKLLEWLTLNTRFNEGSGIHIHTNVYQTILDLATLSSLHINNKFESSFEFIDFLLHKIFKYTGTYNEHSLGEGKSHAIAFRPIYNTIEYRAIPMTYDYSELVKYIMISHLSTNFLIKDVSISKELLMNILDL